MTKPFAFILGAMAVAAAPQAIAQQGPTEMQPEPPAPASSFSDADIKAYAGVAAKLNKIQSDAALSQADKQTQMAAAVQASGLDVGKFNAITESAQADPALQKKIQDAMRQ